MKLFNVLVVVLILFAPATSMADDGARSQAEKLLNVMEMETSMNQSMEMMANLMLQQQPNIAPYRETILLFLKKYMSFQALKPNLIDIYAESFTEQELKELTLFYQTTTGQKALKVMPSLVQKGARLGSQKLIEHKQELADMISAAAEKNK